MVFIQLEEEYRNEANELVKLFLPEKSYCYIDIDKQPIPAPDLLIACLLENESEKSFVQVTMTAEEQEVFREAISATSQGISARKDLKLPLKILLYKALSQYTGKKLPWGALTGIRPVKLVHSLFEQGKSLDEAMNLLTGYYMLSADKASLSVDVALN